MFFSILWSFHLGQHNLQKCFCESLLLSPSILPIQPHLELPHDILLAFDYFIVIRHLSQTVSCLQICFPPLLSFGLPAVILMLLPFSPHSHFTDLHSCFHLCAGSDHLSLPLCSLSLTWKLCVSHKPYALPLPSHLPYWNFMLLKVRGVPLLLGIKFCEPSVKSCWWRAPKNTIS